MVAVSNGPALVRSLQNAATEVSALLSRFDGSHRSRPSTSQERRRLADQAEHATATLESICRDLDIWVAERPAEPTSPERPAEPAPELSDAPQGACAGVAHSQQALDRARAELHESVEAARSEGATWRQIGEALGITAQTAHKRFDPRARRRHAVYMRERNQRLR